MFQKNSDLLDYLNDVEENFLNGKIPYETYKKTILAYEAWQTCGPVADGAEN